MLKNYFKIAFRNLWKQRGFSIINIAGLAIGMSACLLICLYIRFELSYDKFHSKADRIFRIVTDVELASGTTHKASSWAYGPNMARDFPEIESFVRISRVNFLIRRGEAKFQEEKTLFADSSLFKVFDFKLIHGNPNTALRNPLSIVFTQTAAKKYFGNADPTGQTVLLDAEGLVANVTGVVEDLPANSQIKANMFLSASTMKRYKPNADTDWAYFEPMTYLLLRQNASSKSLSDKFPSFLERFAGKIMAEQKLKYKINLEPLTDIYLHTKYPGGLETGNASYIYIFLAVAIFTITIACINFINLTTAQAINRSKEVGMRKVVGASRLKIAWQFISESVILCMLAFIISILISVLLIPYFNELAGKNISLGIANYLLFIFLFLIVAVVIGLLAGFYPAMILSSFEPTLVLKGQFRNSQKGIALRKLLVVVQFTISIVMMIGTSIVHKQLNFLHNKNLGFDKDQILVLNTDADPGKMSLTESISSLNEVSVTALSSSIPGNKLQNASYQIENAIGELQTSSFHEVLVDFSYIPLFKLKMVAGRPFLKTMSTDSSKTMIINETAARMLGYTDFKNAIGKRFRQGEIEGQIIGIIKDFHFQSLQENMQPFAMRIEPEYCNLLSIKLPTNNISQTIKKIEDKWNMLMPNRPFEYFFLDEYFDRQYRNQERFGMLFGNFSFLTIFISCLGLIGLSSYTTVQRKKEVGVRKVLGGSVISIVGLLYSEFLSLVGIAFAIAAPIGYFVSHKWLESFAYRTTVPFWIFLLTAAVTIGISVLTISYQCVRAALADPVKVLKS